MRQCCDYPPSQVASGECRNIRVPDGAASGVDNQRGQQAAAAMAQMARASGPSLAEVLKPEVIVPLLQVCHN